MRTTAEKWHGGSSPRKEILASFEKDAAKLVGDERPILFCFLTDPYQPLEAKERLTRSALEIVGKYKLRSQILTKGFSDIILEDLDLMKDIGTELGLTISFVDDAKRKAWEPFASSIPDRMKTLQAAFEKGIYTWVSLEPVIDAEEALAVIKTAKDFVKYWKVGKLNHMKSEEQKTNWKEFLLEAEALLIKSKSNYYIKNDLRAYE